MRFLIIAFIFAISFAPAASHAETFNWPGHGKVSVSVPDGWNVVHAQPSIVDGQPTNKAFDIVAEPKSASEVSAQFTLIDSPSPLKVEQLKSRLEDITRKPLAGSVEKVFAPKPLTLSQGSGLMVELTDASQVGKPAREDKDKKYYKLVRLAVAFLDDRTMLIVSILFNDPAQPDAEKAMSLLSSLRFERSAAKGQTPATPSGPFAFTTPESHVIVKVSDPSLRPDNTTPLGQNYFKLSRRNPELILSASLAPAATYKDLKWFLKSDSRAIDSDQDVA